ncbi:MAG: hypothetical protein IKB86_07100 [Clostridia bacterium]|nr:hypothetical protein [Clostridia bacterium]
MAQKNLYAQAQELSIKDLMTLIREAASDDEKSFYARILNWHFQRKQKVAIEQNLF